MSRQRQDAPATMKRSSPFHDFLEGRTVPVTALLVGLEDAIGNLTIKVGYDACKRSVVVMNSWVYCCVCADTEETLEEASREAGETRERWGTYPKELRLFGLRVIPSDGMHEPFGLMEERVP